ncbi:MAG TPA: type II toxin-antitoxin system VapC family toxin [Pirellulales bacterium]|nr:type II toxin-antitoxin system VapC family toxin [Pirellulales bacterium]
MRLLVDAHCLIWAVDDPAKLTRAASVALGDAANELLIGAGTMWELSIKTGLGKLALSSPFRQWMEQAIADLDLTVTPISLEHCHVQASLPFHHRDPFDRLLAAQSLTEGVQVVSADAIFDQYGVGRIWA